MLKDNEIGATFAKKKLSNIGFVYLFDMTFDIGRLSRN